jgi:hypothetical protein
LYADQEQLFLQAKFGQQRRRKGMGRGPTMVYLKVTFFWMFFYADIEARVQVNWDVSLWCDFL